MKTYKITLFQTGYKLCPYTLEIEADSKEDAIKEAKVKIAKMGWWGALEYKPIEEKVKLLEVENVEVISE